MSAIDVSSAQPQDLSDLIARYGPDHVIVKLYSAAEALRYQAWTAAQAASARANGCTVGGYVWMYASPVDPRRTVQSALAIAARAGIDLPVLWLDVETFTDGSAPTPREISAAVDEATKAGQRVGIYTGAWFWNAYAFRGTAEFAHLPLWYSRYDGSATLDPPGFGGWQEAAGKQWSGSPIDRSVFRAAFAGR